MAPLYVEALGLAAPGLESWAEGRELLDGASDYRGGAWPTYRAERLAANERRRLTPTIRLALKVAEEADRATPSSSSTHARAVFATCCGDLQTSASICETLAASPPTVSPTQFHNSVQNAPAGYWAIAKGSFSSSTTISAADGTFAAGLLEATAQARVEGIPTMLVAYDYPAPSPLDKLVSAQTPFAVAFVLSPFPQRGERSGDPAALRLELVRGEGAQTMSRPELEALRRGNPAARSLPLLEALAQRADRRVVLPYLDDLSVAVHVGATPRARAGARPYTARESRCGIRET